MKLGTVYDVINNEMYSIRDEGGNRVQYVG